MGHQTYLNTNYYIHIVAIFNFNFQFLLMEEVHRDQCVGVPKISQCSHNETSQMFIDRKILFGPFSVSLHEDSVMHVLAYKKAHTSREEHWAEDLGLALISVISAFVTLGGSHGLLLQRL